MKRDIAELFQDSGIDDLDYRETENPKRHDEALERWRLLRATSLLLGRNLHNVTQLSQASRLFGDER